MRERFDDIPAPPSPRDTNLGGIRRLWLIDARQAVVRDPRRMTGSIKTSDGLILPQTAVVLNPDAVIHVWTFPAGWCNFSEPGLATAQGESFKPQIQLSLPKDHPLTTLAAMRMVGRRWVAIYQDANFYYKVVGSERQPLTFSSSLTNARTCTWQGECIIPSFFLRQLPWVSGPDFLAADFLSTDFNV